MAETTGIAWTDATFNPWIGCTKVGPGCDHCYAEAQNDRWHSGANWGAGAPRRRTSEAGWNGPRKWNRLRSQGVTHFRNGKPVPLWVFCASQADVFDNEVNPEWRADLWELIRETPFLRWQIVTKRVGNVPKMLPADWLDWPDDYCVDIPMSPGARYGHVGIIATMVNQEEVDRDCRKLIELKKIGVRWIGASIEPQLGPITLKWARMHRDNARFYTHDLLTGETRYGQDDGSVIVDNEGGLDWIICGGESIQRGQARPFQLEWGFSLHKQCAEAGVPFFMKQVGSKPIFNVLGHTSSRLPIKNRAGADPSEWPEGLRVRQMPRVYENTP